MNADGQAPRRFLWKDEAGKGTRVEIIGFNCPFGALAALL